MPDRVCGNAQLGYEALTIAILQRLPTGHVSSAGCFGGVGLPFGERVRNSGFEHASPMYVLACVYMWVARENWGQQSPFLGTGNSWYSQMLVSQCLFMNLLRAECCTYARDTGGGP